MVGARSRTLATLAISVRRTSSILSTTFRELIVRQGVTPEPLDRYPAVRYEQPAAVEHINIGKGVNPIWLRMMLDNG